MKKTSLQMPLIIATMILFSLYLCLFSMTKGGRWDLHEQIAMADRVLIGQPMYSSPDSLFQSTSPYFPGISFLSVIVGKISFDHRVPIMLILATLTGIALMVGLIKQSLLISNKKSLAVIFAMLILVWMFRYWKTYMTEFKPDSAVLLLTLGIFYILLELECKPNVLPYILLFIALFMIGLIKQQGISIFLGLACYAIIEKPVKMDRKISLLSIAFVAGVAVLAIILSIPNCFLCTIEIIRHHSLLPTKEIIQKFVSTGKDHVLFIVPLCVYFLQLITKKRVFYNRAERIWLYFCIPWFLMSMISAVKIGGNEGNIEVGLLPFVPYVVLMLTELFTEKEEAKMVFTVLLICTFLLTLYQSLSSYALYNKAQEQKKHEISYLAQRFSGKTALFDGHNYLQITQIGSIPKTEIDTAINFWMAKQDMSKFYKAIHEKQYDYIYSNTPLNEFNSNEFVEEVKNSYTPLIDGNMPESLKGQVYVPIQ